MQRIVLRMPDAFTFRAGQYLEVVHPRGTIPLSIASGPQRLPELHLHYRSTPGVEEAGWMDQLLAGTPTLTIQGPGGDVSLQTHPGERALIVVGGTGVSQALSLIDDRRHSGRGPELTLLWCADHPEDFYLRDELATCGDWLEAVLIADPDRSPRNRGLAWLRAHAPAFAQNLNTVVIAGGPPFVHAAYEVLLAAGVARARIQSDVFSYAADPPPRT